MQAEPRRSTGPWCWTTFGVKGGNCGKCVSLYPPQEEHEVQQDERREGGNAGCVGADLSVSAACVVNLLPLSELRVKLQPQLLDEIHNVSL